MKLEINQIKPNPFKKEINKGRLDQETVKKIQSNMKELGLFGALPVFLKDGTYHLISGHHRLEAVKREFGKDYKINVTVHNYSEENVLRGMIVENLTQRDNEFKEEMANLLLIRKHLKKIWSLSDHISKTKPYEPGSCSDIVNWLNKNNYEVMSPTKIKSILRIGENLKPELLEMVGKAKHCIGNEEGVIPVKDADMLSSIEPEEQEEVLQLIKENELSNQNDRIEMIKTYKELEPEQKQEVLDGKVDLSELERGEKINTPSQIKVKFDKRATSLIVEMRSLRKSLTIFRRGGFYSNFSSNQKTTFKDKLINIKKEYTELIKELDTSLEVV